MPSPYTVLGLTPDATEKEIKNAHRKLVLQYHPDKNQGSQEANEKFVEVQNAFEKLTMQDVDEGEAVPLARERSRSPARRYRSPPPTRRRRDSSPPPPKTASREPIYEERRPRDSSPDPTDRDNRRERNHDRRSCRPPPPPKDPDYQPRGWYEAYAKEKVSTGPRSPRPLYEERRPRGKTDPVREEPRHRGSNARQTVKPTAPLRSVKHSGPSMSDVEPKAGDPVLPSFKQMMSKIADADHLAEKIDRKMFEIYQSVTKNFKLDDRDQKDLRRARTEAAGLHSQVGSLRNAVFECQSEGWRQCHERVLDLYNDCVHMLDILEAANRDLNSIMAGDKTRNVWI